MLVTNSRLAALDAFKFCLIPQILQGKEEAAHVKQISLKPFCPTLGLQGDDREGAGLLSLL